MRITSLILASAACMATDMAAAGGLNSDPSNETATDHSPTEVQRDTAQEATTATASNVSSISAERAPMARKKSAAKKAAAPAAEAGDLAAEIASALTSGDCKAVVWAMPGHEAYRPGSVVIVDSDTHSRLRKNGHARDAEVGELEAAIAAGSVHFEQR